MQGKQLRAHTTRRICLVCLLAWLGVGCGPVPVVARDLRLQLGLERPLVHRDVAAAPSLSGFTRQLALSQADRIIIQLGARSPSQTITDRVVIERVIGMLRISEPDGEQPSQSQSQTIVLITFVIDSPERSVTMRYDPAAQSVSIFNTPNQAWPDHSVANYPVSATFGARLLTAMQTAP